MKEYSNNISIAADIGTELNDLPLDLQRELVVAYFYSIKCPKNRREIVWDALMELDAMSIAEVIFSDDPRDLQRILYRALFEYLKDLFMKGINFDITYELSEREEEEQS